MNRYFFYLICLIWYAESKTYPVNTYTKLTYASKSTRKKREIGNVDDYSLGFLFGDTSDYDYENQREFSLGGSNMEYMGLVEVNLPDGLVGSICGDDWDIRDATVICRQLGMDIGGVIATRNNEFGFIHGPVVYSKVDCTGNETTLEECNLQKWDGLRSLPCDRRRKSAGVVCGCPRERNPPIVSRCFLYTGYPRDELFCQHSCPVNSVLIGERRRHCNRNQKWTERLPTCMKPDKIRAMCSEENLKKIPCLRDDVASAISTKSAQKSCLQIGCCYNGNDPNITCHVPGGSICAKSPCENGGLCKDYFTSRDSYTCICQDPFYGKNCEFRRSWTCGVPSIAPSLKSVVNFRRVFGGKDAVQGSWPWIVQLRQSGKFLCAGTLVHPQWVITAAHCIHKRSFDDDKFKSNSLIVVAGQHSLSGFDKQSQKAEILEIHIQNYTNSGVPRNDIALLKLRTRVRQSANVEPICLPMSAVEFPQEGTRCWITGWGQLEAEQKPKVLQQGDIPIMSNDKCRGKAGPFNDYDLLTDKMFCAGYSIGGVDACSGDSGGPLFCKRSDNSWFLTGVISWGYRCADPNSPGVYTKVAQYLKWIYSLINTSL